MKFNRKELSIITDEIERKRKNDKELKVKSVELQKKYGTLTWEEILQIFTV